MANRTNDIDWENLDKTEVVSNPAGIDFNNLDKTTIIAREDEQGYGTAIKTGLVGGFGSAIKLIDDTVRNEGKPSYKTDAEWREATKNPISDFIQEWGSDLENSNRVQFESMSGESIAQGVSSSIPYIGAMAPIGAAAMKSKSIQPFRVAGITLASKAGLNSKAMLAAGEAMAALAASTPVNIVNSSLEGQAAYNEAIEEGKSENEAQSIKTAVAGLNFLFGVVTETAQFMSVFGQVSELLPKGAKAQLIAKLMGSAASETVDEGVEQAIPDYVQGKPINKDEVLQSAVIGGASGLLFAGAGAGVDYLANKGVKAKTTEAKSVEAKVEEPQDSTQEPTINLSPEMQNARDIITQYRDSLDDDDEYSRLTDLLENGNDEEIMDEADAISKMATPEPEPEPITVDEDEGDEDDVVTGDVVDTISLEPPVVEAPVTTKEPSETPSENEEEYTNLRHNLTADAKTALEKLKQNGTEHWGTAYEEISAPINKAVAEGKLKEEDAKIITDWINKAVLQIKDSYNPPKPPVKTPWQTATDATTAIRNGVRGVEVPTGSTPATTPVEPSKPTPTTTPTVKPTATVEPKPPKPVKTVKPVEPVKPTSSTPASTNIEPTITAPSTDKVKRNKFGFAERLGDYETLVGLADLNDATSYHYTNKKENKTKVIYKTENGKFAVDSPMFDGNGGMKHRYAAFNTLEEAEASITSGKLPKGNKLRAWEVLVKHKKTGEEKSFLGAYEDIKDFVKDCEDKGYEVLLKATPETFSEKLKEYDKKHPVSGREKPPEPKTIDDVDVISMDSKQLEETHVYDPLTNESVVAHHKTSKDFDDKLAQKLVLHVSKKIGHTITFDAKEVVDTIVKNGYVSPYFVDSQGRLASRDKNGNVTIKGGSVIHNFKLIYIGDHGIKSSSLVHEYSHAWNLILRASHPKLWKAGVDLLKKTQAWEDVKRVYPHLISKGDDEIASEALAQLLGLDFQKSIRNLENQGLSKGVLNKLKDWFKKYWKAIKSLFESEDSRIAKMTLEEFVNMPLADLLKDIDINKVKPVKPVKTTSTTTNGPKATTDTNEPKKLDADVASRKYDVYVRAQNEQAKKILEKPDVKEEVIAMCLGNPKLEHNKEGSKYLYRVTYTDASGKVIQKNVKAAIHHAVKKITGVKSTPYEKKAPVAPVVDDVTDKIRSDTDLQPFFNSREIRQSQGFKYMKEQDRIAEIEDTLLDLEMTDGKNVAEELREIATEEIPLVGKDSSGNAYREYENKISQWMSDELGLSKDQIELKQEVMMAYCKYLVNKHHPKGLKADFLILPVSKDQTNNQTIKDLEQRLLNKESRIKIWKETGWYKAKDGRWKYFLDDNLGDINLEKIANKNGELYLGAKTTVGELYNNPELFSRFSYLKDIKVETKEYSSDEGGHYDRNTKTIVIRDAGKDTEWYKRVLLHEMEHVIQHHEGMAKGTNPDNILESFQRTRQVMLLDILKFSDEASDYFEGASQLMLDKYMFFDGDFKEANAEVKGFKQDFYDVATQEEITLVERYLSILKDNLKNMEENDITAIDPEYSDKLNYMNALGEEEARVAMYATKEKADSLSENDKAIAEKATKLIEKMPKRIAKWATRFLFDASSARSDSYDWKTSERELSEHPKGQALLKEFDKVDNKADFYDSLAYLHFVMGHDDHSIVFLGDGGKAYSENKSGVHNGGPSVEVRLRKAVTTVKPTNIKEEIDRAGGKKGWLSKQWRKVYRAMVDKEVDLKDLDEFLESVLGRALADSEKIYNKVRMIGSKASGFANALIEGNERHIKILNENMQDKPMKYAKATLANVLDIVNAEKMNKLAPNYLAKFGKDYTWVEAFGTYLGWRRLAEMARLKREAFYEEHSAWKARKKAYDEWVKKGRVGDNPQKAEYAAWEAYQKAKKNAKRRWERNGKIGPDPSEAIKTEWLATHKDEDAPLRYVGKEPEFKAYDMPEGLTEQDLYKAIQDAPPPFAEAANLYYKLNDNILCIMEDAGLISAELHELLNTKYKEYCPMIRDFSDTAAVDTFVESISVGGKGVGNVSSMLQKISAEGSKRTIINPLESTVQTIAAVTNRAERNKAGQHLVKMMTSDPSLEGYISKLEQPRYGTINADPKNCIFTVMHKGKKIAYRSDPDYYQAIVGYNKLVSSILIKVPETLAKSLKTGVTMSPSFIVRNIFRDTITAGIASKNGFVPIVDTIRGARALWYNPEFRAKFEAAGIVNFNQYGSSASAYHNITALGSGKNFTVYEPKQIIKGVLQAAFKGKGMEALKTVGISLEQLSSFAESATRAGEFKKALDAGKSMSDAAFDAKEITIDFSRSGIVGQEFNRVIPFFNACIQGGDVMMRLLYNNPTTTALRIAQYIAAPSFVLWILNKNEDWYEELEPSVKYTHWCLPNGIRVPKPQEYGVLFGGSIEAMLDQATKKNPRAMKEFIDAAKDVLSPSILPTLALPLIEWTTNYSFFKGRDLVPQRLQRLPDELQYSTGTSEASKFIGKYTHWSPMKIDNVVRGYTGTMGMLLWQIPDLFAPEMQNLPTKHANEVLFVRDFNVTDVVRNRYVNDFYELQQKANQYQAGYGLKGKPSASVRAIRNVGQTINELNKQIRIIETSDKYSPDKKRELIDKKKERIKEIAKHIVQKYGEEYL